MTNKIQIVEVGPRDGLQNEKTFVATADKIELINRLAAAGLTCVEATSFVSEKWVPQLADAADVLAGIVRRPDTRYPVLVPNEYGYERALAAKVTEIAVFSAASEQFNQKNINASIEQSLARFAPLMTRAKDDGIRVRGYVSTVLGCPYQGEVAIADVVHVAKKMYAMGCFEISLGDTIGVGTPRKAVAMLRAVADEVPMTALAVHFHDTYGQAIANVAACVEAGVRVVDASVSGTGGCPYAKGASGNVATEDVVYLLHGMGFETGVELDELVQTGRWLSNLLGRPSASKVNLAMAGL